MIVILLLVLTLVVGVWLIRRNRGRADVTTTTGTRQPAEPNIVMEGKITLDSGQPNNLSVFVRGRGNKVKSDGTYRVVLSKADFTDDFGSTVTALPVEFIDFKSNQHYQLKRGYEPIAVELPAELMPSNNVVRASWQGSAYYTPSYTVHRDYDLVLVQ